MQARRREDGTTRDAEDEQEEEEEEGKTTTTCFFILFHFGRLSSRGTHTLWSRQQWQVRRRPSLSINKTMDFRSVTIAIIGQRQCA